MVPPEALGGLEKKQNKNTVANNRYIVSYREARQTDKGAWRGAGLLGWREQDEPSRVRPFAI